MIIEIIKSSHCNKTYKHSFFANHNRKKKLISFYSVPANFQNKGYSDLTSIDQTELSVHSDEENEMEDYNHNIKHYNIPKIVISSSER